MTTATAPLEDMLRLDAQFCFPLYAATNLITRAYRPLLRPLGLTYSQYLVMLVLWEERATSVKALGARLLLDSGTLSPLLQRLQANGLVKKRADPDDKRRVIVALTAKGERLREAARAVPEALICRLLERGGGLEAAAQLQILQAQLRSLIAHWNTDDSNEDDDSDDEVPAPRTRSTR